MSGPRPSADPPDEDVLSTAHATGRQRARRVEVSAVIDTDGKPVHQLAAEPPCGDRETAAEEC